MAQSGSGPGGYGAGGEVGAFSLPVMVSALVLVHVCALAYWIYRLASDKPEERRKVH